MSHEYSVNKYDTKSMLCFMGVKYFECAQNNWGSMNEMMLRKVTEQERRIM